MDEYEATVITNPIPGKKKNDSEITRERNKLILLKETETNAQFQFITISQQKVSQVKSN